MLTRIGFANDALHATVMTSCHYRTDASHSYANFSLNLNLLRVFPRRFMHRFPHSLGTPVHHTHHTQCTHSIQIYFFVVVIFQRFHYKFSLSSRALFSPNWIIFFCLALQCCHIFENIIYWLLVSPSAFVIGSILSLSLMLSDFLPSSKKEKSSSNVRLFLPIIEKCSAREWTE